MDAQTYYNQLAPYYHLIYLDWESELEEEAQQLDKIITDIWENSVHRIIDVACGIGTQSIGLAKIGYSITGTDIAQDAVIRARKEAEKLRLNIKFYVSDITKLSICNDDYDLVIACDNVIPHLLTDDHILKAFKEFYTHIRIGGGCLISVRDYKLMQLGGIQFYPRYIHQEEKCRVILFDVWYFEGDLYEMSTYIIEDCGNNTEHRLTTCRTLYRCIFIERLEELMRRAGFVNVQTLRECYSQPVIVGTKQ